MTEKTSPGSVMVEILEYTPSYQTQVLELILTIQQGEYGIPITAEDQPDLMEIGSFYQKDGNFWVAVTDRGVVGTVAVKHIGGGDAMIRKMFVRREYRGKDKEVSSLLLSRLLDWARTEGVKRLFLGTTPQFLAAHRFYEKKGFREIGERDLPANFPVMAVDKKFYMYTLC